MKKKQFTLIELLIVITIIAILTSMLLPTLGAVKSKSRKTQCAGNVKQLCMALIAYDQDFKSMPSHGDRAPGSCSTGFIGAVPVATAKVFVESYLNGKTTDDDSNVVLLLSTLKITRCPEAMDRSQNDATSFNYVPWGFACDSENSHVKMSITRMTKLAALKPGKQEARLTPAIWTDRSSSWMNGNSQRYFYTNHGKHEGDANGCVRNHGIGMNIGFADGSFTWRDIDQYTGTSTPDGTRGNEASYCIKPYEAGTYYYKSAGDCGFYFRGQKIAL